MLILKKEKMKKIESKGGEGVRGGGKKQKAGGAVACQRSPKRD